MGPAGTSRLSPEGTREAKHTAGETAGVVVSGKHRLKCRLHNLEKNLSSTFLLPKVKKAKKCFHTSQLSFKPREGLLQAATI